MMTGASTSTGGTIVTATAATGTTRGVLGRTVARGVTVGGAFLAGRVVGRLGLLGARLAISGFSHHAELGLGQSRAAGLWLRQN